MSLLKNSVAGNYPSAGWEKSRKQSRPERKTNRHNRSEVKPDSAQTQSHAFAEDFMLEHSSSSMRLSFTVVPSTSGAVSQESYPSSEYFGFPS
jgi:hypothetical protein